MAFTNKAKENPERFYKYINSKRRTQERRGPLKDQCGHLFVEPQESSDYLKHIHFSEENIPVKLHMGG